MSKKRTNQEGLIKHFTMMVTRILKSINTEIHSIDEKSIMEAFQQAKETAISLREISKEEADIITGSVKKDFHNIFVLLKETNRSIYELLKLDVSLMEEPVWKIINTLADQTLLKKLEFKIHPDNIYVAKDIVLGGDFECLVCHQIESMEEIGILSECKKCKGKRFSRC